MVAEGTTISGLFTGVYEDDRLSGDVDYGTTGEGKWSAVRIPAEK